MGLHSYAQQRPTIQADPLGLASRDAVREMAMRMAVKVSGTWDKMIANGATEYDAFQAILIELAKLSVAWYDPWWASGDGLIARRRTLIALALLYLFCSPRDLDRVTRGAITAEDTDITDETEEWKRPLRRGRALSGTGFGPGFDKDVVRHVSGGLLYLWFIIWGYNRREESKGTAPNESFAGSDEERKSNTAGSILRRYLDEYLRRLQLAKDLRSRDKDEEAEVMEKGAEAKLKKGMGDIFKPTKEE